jgi:hypothetical protein
MSEQGVDLRSTWAVLRRRRGALALAGLFGAVAGAGLLYVLPSPYTSTSVVLLPTATQAGSGRTGGYDAETQVLIAQSADVLGRAGLAVTPHLSGPGVKDLVTVDAPTPSIIRFTARGASRDEAELLSAASAQSLVDYLEESANELSQAKRSALQERLDALKGSLDSLNAQIQKTSARMVGERPGSTQGRADAGAVAALTASQGETVLQIENVKNQLSGEQDLGGQVSMGASVIQRASPGEQSDFLTRALGFVAGGAALFVAVAALFVALTNRRDPKLRSRDEIADAVGIPVLASLRTRPARTATGWVELLEGYTPPNVDGWALRQLLRSVAPSPVRVGGRGPGDAGPVVVVLFSLSDDDAALAAGPQLASFAASTGVTTQLVAAQPHESANALWAACGRLAEEAGPRPALSVTTRPGSPTDSHLVVQLAVLDGDDPEPDPRLDTGAVALLAVSAASATRVVLADAVVAADRAGLVIDGLIVTNPDPLDRTTGRLVPRETSSGSGAAGVLSATVVGRTAAGSAARPRRTQDGSAR